MPRFEPFAGLRYDAGRVDLSMVVAPPYDVIDPDQRARLAAQHSANAVRIELPEPDHRAGLDRYHNAARQLERWQEEGLVVRDPEPSFYAYRMVSAEGHTTNGVIGALGVDDQSAEEILPHELTLARARSDRLDLLVATRANLSPIWGLSMAPGVTKASLRNEAPDAEAVDEDGVRHQLWVISDQDSIEAISEAVGSAPLVLADGHHRYETARTYRDALAAGTVAAASAGVGTGAGAGAGAGAQLASADLIMALVVELVDDQLEVGPVHRALSGLPDGLDLVDMCASWFDLTRAGDFDSRTAGALGASGALALLMPSGCWLLSPKDGTQEAAGSNLDSSMVALVIAELPDHELAYLTSWQAAVHSVATEESQAVLLLRPVSVDQIAEWAGAGRRMPPKSTYFHPKPRTGMVFRTLDPA